MFTANARLPAAAAGLQPELSNTLPQSPWGYDEQVREDEAAWSRPGQEQTGASLLPCCSSQVGVLTLLWPSSGWVTLGKLLTLSELLFGFLVGQIEMSLALPPRVAVRKHAPGYLRFLELCTGLFFPFFMGGFLDSLGRKNIGQPWLPIGKAPETPLQFSGFPHRPPRLPGSYLHSQPPPPHTHTHSSSAWPGVQNG